MNLRKIVSLLLVFISLNLSAATLHELSSGRKFRKLVNKLVYLTSLPGEKERADGLKVILSNNPIVFNWMIEGRELKDLIQLADLQEILPDIEEFLHDELDVIIKTVDDYKKLQEQNEDLLDKFQNMNLIDISNEKLGLKAFGVLDQGDRLRLLNMHSEEVFINTVNKTEAKIRETSFSNSKAIKMLKNPDTGFDLSNLPTNIQNYIERLTVAYYDEMSFSDKRRMIQGILKLNPFETVPKKLSIILNHSGPVVQKLFQLIGQDVKSANIKEIMEELKQNVKPFAWKVAKKTIDREISRLMPDKKFEDIFCHFNEDPLAAATVGQVYMAKLCSSDETVIVKVMRPGIRKKAKQEIATFYKYADNDTTKTFVSQVEESIKEELDFTIEYKNLLEGQNIYNKFKFIKAVESPNEFPATKTVLLMKLASGRSLASYKNKDTLAHINERGLILRELLLKWVRTALFETNGFFHADLHSGNIFYDYEAGVLTLIDFGSVGHLSNVEKQSMIDLGIGTYLKSTRQILRSFTQMTELTDEQYQELDSKVRKTLKSDLSLPDKITDIVSSALGLNISVPRNFVLFNRGRTFLEKQLLEINELLDQVDRNHKFKRHNLDHLYVKAILKKAPIRSILRSKFSHH